MIRRAIDYVRNSDVLSGGLGVYAAVGLLITLFVIGAALGSLRGGDRNTSLSLPNGHPETDSAGRATPALSVSATPRAMESGKADEASTAGQTGGIGPKRAQELDDDISEAVSPPEESGGRGQESHWLADNFGPGVAPTDIAGFRLTSVERTETTVTAYYRGESDAGAESLRLAVGRLGKPVSPRALQDLLGEFESNQIAYQYGGRSIRQGMTAEDHPALFPPALALCWRVDSYGIQLVAIPNMPGEVTRARQAALDVLAVLKY